MTHTKHLNLFFQVLKSFLPLYTFAALGYFEVNVK